jgi:hypothetical protein
MLFNVHFFTFFAMFIFYICYEGYTTTWKI